MSSEPAPTYSKLSMGGSIRGPHRLAGAIGSCPKQFGFHYLDKLKTRVEPEFRLLGSLVHDCLAWHFGPMLAEPPEFLQQPLEERLRERIVDSKPEIIAKAQEVAAAYVQFFAADPWTPLFVEREFTTTLGELDPGGPYPELDGEIVSCQTDLGVLGNGWQWVVDYKCMGGEWGRDRLPVWSAQVEREYKWQAMVNLHVVRKTLPNLRGFIVRRVKRRIPYDFDSNIVRYTPEEYAEVPRIARYAVKRDLELQAQHRSPDGLPKNLTACVGKYGPCDFTDLCHARNPEARAKTLVERFIQFLPAA